MTDLATAVAQLAAKHGPQAVLTALAELEPHPERTDPLITLMGATDPDALRRLIATLDRQLGAAITASTYHQPPLAALAALVAAVDRTRTDTDTAGPRTALDRLRQCDELRLARRLTQETP